MCSYTTFTSSIDFHRLLSTRTQFGVRQMQFLGVHQPDQTSKSTVRREPVVPQAIIVGQTGSPGVSLDLGRTGAALPGVTRSRGYVQCDVLLVMTRNRAALLYFAVGEDVR